MKLPSPRSLRMRLTIGYAASMAAGLGIFMLLALAAIDATLRQTLDTRLAIGARGFSAVVDAGGGRLNFGARARERLLSILQARQNGAVLAADGSVVIDSAVVPAPVRAFARASRDRSSYATVRAAGEPLRVIASPLSSRGRHAGTIVVWRSIDFIVDYERSAFASFAATFAVILGVATALGSFIAKRGLRPLVSVASQASEIEARDLARRLDSQSTDDELVVLCSTFNRMLDRLEAAFERQRRFTADASHDLRAPLAVMRTEVELALRRERTNDALREALSSVGTVVDELDALVDALLASARADAGMAEHSDVDIGESLRAIAERMQPVAAAAGVRIVCDAAGELRVRAESRALESSLHALVHNAITFASSPGGRVTLSAHAAGPAAIRLAVADDGPGFTEQGLQHATERFWRGDAARGRGGTGLGLAIVRSVVEAWSGTLELRNASMGGAVVEITLPRSHTNSTDESEREVRAAV